MKKHLLIPLLTVTGSGVCFLLRILQNRHGFEPGTGLPVSGHPLSVLLPACLFLLAAALLLLTRQLSPEQDPEQLEFQDCFSSSSTVAAMLAVGGILLTALSGAAGLLLSDNGLSVGPGLYIAPSITSRRLDLLTHGLAIPAALCLFPAAVAGYRGNRTDRSSRVNGNLILFPVIYLVFRLTLSYREMSVNASQQTYYVELLALMLLILSLYRLSSLALHCGNTRRFVLYAAMAVILCLTALADTAALSDRLFFAGSAALLLGFLFLRLTTPDSPSANT